MNASNTWEITTHKNIEIRFEEMEVHIHWVIDGLYNLIKWLIFKPARNILHTEIISHKLKKNQVNVLVT